MNEEEWRELVELPGYWISSCGRVYNENTESFRQCVNPSGYSRFGVWINGSYKQFSVHRLVAYYFVPGYDVGLEVNHIDGDKSNCREENLEWVTSRGNNIHAIRTCLRKAGREKSVRIIETGETFRSLAGCARYIGGTLKGISSVLRGQKKSHRGYRFEYVA